MTDAAGMPRARAKRPSPQDWRRLGDEALLGRRVSSLGLELAGSPLEGLVEQVGGELEARGLRFRPYAWLSSDWFTPDDLTGFAIPFTLADRRLIALERRQLLSVEGGTRAQCLRILRHETAHALV